MDDNRGSRKAVVLVFLVFVLGIALGALGTYVVTTRVLAARPQGVSRTPANTVAMFTRDLNLNPDQQKQIEAILNNTQRPKFEDLLRRMDEDRRRRQAEGQGR